MRFRDGSTHPGPTIESPRGDFSVRDCVSGWRFLTGVMFLSVVTLTEQPLRSSELFQSSADRSCDTRWLPPDPSWALQEQEVWRAQCGRGIADVSQVQATEIRVPFLRQLLNSEPYRSVIARNGFRLKGAHFRDALELPNIAIMSDLLLMECSFDQGVDLRGLHLEGMLSLQGSNIHGSVNLSLVSAKSINFSGASTVDGTINMNQAVAPDGINLDALTVHGLLMFGEARLGLLWLQGARVDRMLYLGDADISGAITMREVEVKGDLQMPKLKFSSINLKNARIAGDVSFEGARPSSRTSRVDLSGARMERALVLGSSSTNPRAKPYGPVPWKDAEVLDLRNAYVRDMHDGIKPCDESDCADTWPRRLELTGFVYDQLGPFDEGNTSDMSERPTWWWTEWLARQRPYSPQPYEQLASVLSKLGYRDRAREILYESKDRERKETTSRSERVVLSLQRAFIGYGYYPYYSLWWVLGFVVLGALVLRVSGEGAANHMPFGIAYSLDMLLPVIRLREAHYEIELRGWPRYYFYGHKLMGYVLASFVVAAVGGLTQA